MSWHLNFQNLHDMCSWYLAGIIVCSTISMQSMQKLQESEGMVQEVFKKWTTVNRESFIGLNGYGFCGFQEHRESFPMKISTSLK